MEPFYPTVKEEYTSSPPTSTSGTSLSSPEQPPRPIEGLHEVGPPPFLTKTYEMVDDHSIDCVVSWSREGRSFVVWDPRALSTTVLPRYFKHNNFSSFVRQLNTYVGWGIKFLLNEDLPKSLEEEEDDDDDDVDDDDDDDDHLQ